MKYGLVQTLGVNKIKSNDFKAILRFSDRGTEIKEIPPSINYSESQREPIEIYGEPDDTYFGDCDKLFFIVNKDYMKHLLKYKHCDERFMGSGRLKIEIKD